MVLHRRVRTAAAIIPRCLRCFPLAVLIFAVGPEESARAVAAHEQAVDAISAAAEDSGEEHCLDAAGVDSGRRCSASGAASALLQARVTTTTPRHGHPHYDHGGIAQAAVRTCLITQPYVGHTNPPYLCFLIRTVEQNMGLDFHMPATTPPPSCKGAALPNRGNGGGKFFHHALWRADFEERARKRLNFSDSEAQQLASNIAATPYGNHDLKPALGLLYEDWLEGCDYWGWADLDIVFGDLSLLRLHKHLYDVMCPFAPYSLSAGPLMILRKSPETLRAFLSSRDWKQAFLDPKSNVFDEWWGDIQENDVDKATSHLDDMNRTFHRAIGLRKSNGAIFGACQADLWNPQIWPHCAPEGVVPYCPLCWSKLEFSDDERVVTWQDGKLQILTSYGKEVQPVYFHFMLWKKSFSHVPGSASDCFIIRATGIFNACDTTT